MHEVVPSEYDLMLKRRLLTPGTEAIIIYDVHVGFTQQLVRFIEYRKVEHNGIIHQTPVFRKQNEEITGLDCFWILPSDIQNDLQLEQIQRELIGLQISTSAFGKTQGYKVPEKIKDKEIKEMSEQLAKDKQEFIDKIGYDPRDYSWAEKELAEDNTERSWFQFQRESGGSFNDDWSKTVKIFNQKFHQNINEKEAFRLTKKWKRYLIGAWNTIASQNKNVEDWKKAALDFEAHHREIEERMFEWSKKHEDAFPLVKVKKPIRFRCGPYFNACLEKIPKLFTSSMCSKIKEGVVLQVVAYDPQEKYIRLEFTPDIRKLIKPEEDKEELWSQMEIDYVIYVPPEEVETHIDMLQLDEA